MIIILFNAHLFVMTLLVPLLHHTAPTTDLHWELLTFRVSNKFSGGSVTLAVLE